MTHQFKFGGGIISQEIFIILMAQNITAPFMEMM